MGLAGPRAWAASKVVAVDLEATDQMRYSKRKIEVPHESIVKLTLTHVGKMPKVAMGHNFVLLKPEADRKTFVNAAMAARDTDYIPAKMKSAVIAHTRLIGGGESDTITFPSPEPGTYPYLCSFPGHASVMNGELHVKE